MIRTQLYIEITVPRHQALQFQHAFSWHDHLLLIEVISFELRLTKRQPMTIRRNRPKLFSPGLKQHAIQVIANILLSHRKVRLVDQPPERRLAHRYRLASLDVFYNRKFGCRQGYQVETAFAGTNREFLPAQAHINFRAFWQSPANIQELAPRYRRFTVRL